MHLEQFVQFQPTALDVDARPLPLVTEALRGAGARIIDETGASIMRNAHPLPTWRRATSLHVPSTLCRARVAARGWTRRG